MKKETKVNCEVENCKHNESKKCDLDELDISCTCDNKDCEDKQETICNNFEKNEEDDRLEEVEEIEDSFEEEQDDENKEDYYEETIEENVEIYKEDVVR